MSIRSQELGKWPKRFMELAFMVKSWSKDPQCRVGCIIVSPDMRQFTVGYNGFPRGVDDDVDIPDKNDYMVHAEINALLNSTQNLEGWIAYVTRAPCLDCAKALVQAQVGKVVVHHGGDYFYEPESKWFTSCKKAEELLISVGISYDVGI